MFKYYYVLYKMTKMSQVITLHKLEKCEKCPNCEEEMYNFSSGVLKCDCGYTDDSF